MHFGSCGACFTVIAGKSCCTATCIYLFLFKGICFVHIGLIAFFNKALNCTVSVFFLDLTIALSRVVAAVITVIETREQSGEKM